MPATVAATIALCKQLQQAVAVGWDVIDTMVRTCVGQDHSFFFFGIFSFLHTCLRPVAFSRDSGRVELLFYNSIIFFLLFNYNY